jgi:hypothetical protein
MPVLEAQPASAAPSTTIPRLRMIVSPLPIAIQAQRAGEINDFSGRRIASNNRRHVHASWPIRCRSLDCFGVKSQLLGAL